MLKSEELQFILYLKGFSAFCSQKSAVDFFSFSHLPTVEFKVEYILTFFPQNLNCGKLWKTYPQLINKGFLNFYRCGLWKTALCKTLKLWKTYVMMDLPI